MSEDKQDEKGNLIYHKDFAGCEYWWDHDDRRNVVHGKNSNGCELWQEWDERNRKIYYRDSGGKEIWWEYDKREIRINITRKKLEERKIKEQEKEFLSREPVMRFELMDI